MFGCNKIAIAFVSLLSLLVSFGVASTPESSEFADVTPMKRMANEATNENIIPPPPKAAVTNNHFLRVQFCTSCGMQRNYLQLKQFLEFNFPELQGRIHGENYPPPAHAIILSNAVSALQLFAMLAMLVGDNIWNYIPMMNGPPSWYFGVKENPVPALIGTFILVPTFANSFVTTGAFEVELDGDVIFSKIGTGRFPTGTEIVNLLTKAGLTKIGS